MCDTPGEYASRNTFCTKDSGILDGHQTFRPVVNKGKNMHSKLEFEYF